MLNNERIIDFDSNEEGKGEIMTVKIEQLPIIGSEDAAGGAVENGGALEKKSKSKKLKVTVAAAKIDNSELAVFLVDISASYDTQEDALGIQKMVQQAVPSKSQDIYHPVSTEESAAEYPARKNVEAKRSYDFKIPLMSAWCRRGSHDLGFHWKNNLELKTSIWLKVTQK
ncbi:hypothetical protein K7X08_022504 [Anisodus acutangulus]|uniref:Uncharacterized protein n=1 Tax=Anisodus acutangulus TaxID=402998 RepID=A0A9Q1MJ51_9SOLA|nr:hypothetical protein K7X08_022504 [Anisodus acutangulus]